MNIEYRQSLPSDAGLLVGIYNAAFHDDFVRFGECPACGKTVEEMRQSILRAPKEIIYCDGVAVGAVSVHRRGDGDYYVGCLCVIPGYQGRGIGTLSVGHIKEKYSDWRRISLITPADKPENVAFYTEKCGFTAGAVTLDGNVRVVELSTER